MKIVVFSLLLLLSLQKGGSSIEGRVLRSTNQIPVAGATILLTKIGGQFSDYQTTATTDSGAFTFRNLSSGNYRVFVQRDDYVTTEYGQVRSMQQGTQITVKGNDSIKDIIIPFTPTGVITGKASDVAGDPVRGAWVFALRAVYRDGERMLDPIQPVPRTDDHGEYRIFDLVPGSYLINVAPSASPSIEGGNYLVRSSQSPPAYFRDFHAPSRTALADAIKAGTVDPIAFATSVDQATFYPATTDSTAALPVEVSPGEAVAGIDVKIQRVQAVTIRGKVTNGMTSGPQGNVRLTLQPDGSRNSPSIRAVSQTLESDGSFLFTNVSPGKYEITASESQSRARRKIDVGNSEIEGVQIVLQPQMPILARVRIEGHSSPESDPDLAGIVLQLLPFGVLTPLDKDRNATLETYGPGDYRLSMRVRPDVYVKSIRLGTRELSSSVFHLEAVPGSLEILLSTKGGKATGTVANAAQQPIAGARVALVPATQLRQRIDLYKSATTDLSGKWEIRSIAPGEYKAFAWESISENSWQDPAVIRNYENQGVRVVIHENDEEQLKLKAIPSSR
jgi:protocatechuate 3,4-dioxygenase beta subunit